MWYLTYQGRSGHKHIFSLPLYMLLSHFSCMMRLLLLLLECALLKWSTVRKIVCIRIFTLNFKPCIYITVISKILLYSIFSNTWHIFANGKLVRLTLLTWHRLQTICDFLIPFYINILNWIKMYTIFVFYILNRHRNFVNANPKTTCFV